MSKKIDKLPDVQVLNDSERMQYAQLIRLDALCNMMSSFIETYSQINKVATEDNVVVEKASVKRAPRKRTTKKSE